VNEPDLVVKLLGILQNEIYEKENEKVSSKKNK